MAEISVKTLLLFKQSWIFIISSTRTKSVAVMLAFLLGRDRLHCS